MLFAAATFLNLQATRRIAHINSVEESCHAALVRRHCRECRRDSNTNNAAERFWYKDACANAQPTHATVASSRRDYATHCHRVAFAERTTHDSNEPKWYRDAYRRAQGHGANRLISFSPPHESLHLPNSALVCVCVHPPKIPSCST